VGWCRSLGDNFLEVPGGGLRSHRSSLGFVSLFFLHVKQVGFAVDVVRCMGLAFSFRFSQWQAPMDQINFFIKKVPALLVTSYSTSRSADFALPSAIKHLYCTCRTRSTSRNPKSLDMNCDTKTTR